METKNNSLEMLTDRQQIEKEIRIIGSIIEARKARGRDFTFYNFTISNLQTALLYSK